MAYTPSHANGIAWLAGKAAKIMEYINEDAARWLKTVEAGLVAKARQSEQAAQRSAETGRGAVNILDEDLNRKLSALAKEEAKLRKEMEENRRQAKVEINTAIREATIDIPKKRIQQAMGVPTDVTQNAPSVAETVRAGQRS